MSGSKDLGRCCRQRTTLVTVASLGAKNQDRMLICSSEDRLFRLIHESLLNQRSTLNWHQLRANGTQEDSDRLWQCNDSRLVTCLIPPPSTACYTGGSQWVSWCCASAPQDNATIPMKMPVDEGLLCIALKSSFVSLMQPLDKSSISTYSQT